jgi:riboflavin biosynthesis pyrimidine reductase
MLLPEPRPVDDDDLLDAYDWPESPGRPWVRGLMAMSLDGTFVGPDGLSGSVSGPGDHRVFAASRALSDAYLVGAGTIRAEGYKAVRARPALASRRAARGLRPAPTMVVVTAHCRFDWAEARWVDSDERPVIMTTEAADPERRAAAVAHGCEVVIVGGDTVELPAALEELRRRDLTRVNCEGGPSLLGELIGQERLDELALTVSPLATHAPVPRAAGRVVLTGFALDVLLEEDGFLFGRYVRDADATARAQQELSAGAGIVGGPGAAS